MTYKEINPEQAKQVINESSNLLLLDVREQQEYDEAHIANVVLMPLGSLPERFAELDKDQPTLCICAGGFRSEKASRYLLSQGFSDVTNMSEGMKGWLQRGLPTAD